MHTRDELDCSACRQHFTALERGELDPAVSAQVTLHLAHCADCSAELQQVQQLFLLLDRQEAAAPTLAARFAAGLAALPASPPAPAALSLFQRFWPSRPAWAFAYSCALLVCGVATGQLLPGSAGPQLPQAPGATICPVQSAPSLWMPAPRTASLA